MTTMKTSRTVAALLLAPVLAVVAPRAARGQDTAAAPQAAVVLKNRAPVARETLRVRFPRPKSYTLPNGLRILVLEDHKLPTVTMSLSLASGSFFEPATKTGLASMTAAMLDEGTTTRTSEQIAATADRLGASVGASAAQGEERAYAYASGLSTDTDAILGLFRDILRNPTFPQDQFDKVKRQTVAGITRATRDPGTLAEIAVRRAVYGEAPPASVLPSVAQVNALTRADLAAFHARYYRPERGILGIVGDVNADQIVAKVKAAFGDWKRGTDPVRAPLPAFAPQTATRVFLVERPGSVQTAIRIGNLGIDRNSRDYVPFLVMNRILGGGSSISSRLGRNLREARGYTYDVRSVFTTPRFPGYWGVQTDVRTPVTAGALTEFFNEFRRIQDEPVTAQELDNAKRGMVGSFARRLEDPELLLSYALELEEFGLPADYWDRYPALVEAVTVADVQRVARDYIGAGRVQIVAVGERATVEEALRPYGQVTVVDVASGLVS